MADVRALLRQQRSARRVDHPHAVYSDSGKLSCSVCREPVRSDSAWDGHVRSQSHRTSVTRLRKEAEAPAPTPVPAPTQPANALGLTDSNVGGAAHKRRLSEVLDADDGDVEMGGGDGGDERKTKRTRSEAATSTTAATAKPQIQIQVPDEAQSTRPTATVANGEPRKSSAQLTPPLGRRSSGTPVQGVEMQIPSRPATPIATKDSFIGGNPFSGAGGSSNGGGFGIGIGIGMLQSAASTPKNGYLGRSPLIPQGEGDSVLSKPLPGASAVASAAAALSAATTSSAAPAAAKPTSPVAAAAVLPQVDEDEWAAFEADVVNAPAALLPASSATKPDFSGAAVISGAAVLADGTAVAGDGEGMTRREAEEAKQEDEREEATRALEDEFEDMQELESRVRKLREKREALRSQPGTSAGSSGNSISGSASMVFAAKAGAASPAGADAIRRASATMIDKENIRQQVAAAQKGAAGGHGEAVIAEEDEQEDDDEDDEDEDADWDVFRFKA